MGDSDPPDIEPANNVLEFVLRPTDCPAEPRGTSCPHDQVWVDRKRRQCECKTCGAVVSSFDAVSRIAEKWARYANWTRHTQQERDRLSIEAKELKRQRRNLKAQVRRAAKKQSPTPLLEWACGKLEQRNEDELEPLAAALAALEATNRKSGDENLADVAENSRCGVLRDICRRRYDKHRRQRRAT